jgi:hypothetical protein
LGMIFHALQTKIETNNNCPPQFCTSNCWLFAESTINSALNISYLTTSTSAKINNKF